jgi:hypothetical protein
MHLGFSTMRNEELTLVDHLHEFNPSDDTSGIIEGFKAKHRL